MIKEPHRADTTAGRELGSGLSRCEDMLGRRNAAADLAGGETERWYVAHTQPHAEDRALVNLARQNFRAFCPRLHRTARHARKLTHVLAPLFPGYIFVKLDLGRDHWRSVNGTRGVVRLISQNDLPTAVPPGIVEEIRRHIDVEGAMDWSTALKAGDTVRICDGPFAELVGTLESLDASGRVRVLLSLMGRAVSVSARSEMVAPGF